MSYSSINFMIFLLITLLLFYVVPKKIQWIILLLASIFFYCFSNYLLGIYLFITVFTTWGAALLIHNFNFGNMVTKRSKKSVLVFSIAVILNFLIIAAFKISGISLIILSGIGIDLTSLILPIGLSFYTFQTIGYLTDVFRYSTKPQTNFAKYFLFASFFPQILSGPIGRFDQLSPQFFKEKKYRADDLSMGAQRIIWGMFKKLVIADRVAIIVNEIFNNPTQYGGPYIVLGVMLFVIQLYADFSGLIDIAAGAAQMFQIELATNFNTPLFARNISDFWSRWHMSLSSWFKDYLFYPLLKSGLFSRMKEFLKKIFGKKKSKNLTTYIGMFILWLAIGCWHGVKWHFIIGAGLMFGLYIIGGKVLSPVFESISRKFKIKKEKFSYKLFEVVRTFLLLCFAMLFWRADSLSSAFLMIKRLGVFEGGSILKLGLDINNFIVMWISIATLLLVDIIHYKGFKIRTNLIKQKIWIKWPIYIIAIMSILLLGMYGPKYNASDFIYFKF